MKSKPTITFITALALMFAWVGQVLGAPCLVLTEASISISHPGHGMAGASQKHGCADCQTEIGCEGTLLHCLKADEKANVVQKIVKTAPDLTPVPVHITFKAKHHQIRASGILPAAVNLSSKTPNSLRIRLQV